MKHKQMHACSIWKSCQYFWYNFHYGHTFCHLQTKDYWLFQHFNLNICDFCNCCMYLLIWHCEGKTIHLCFWQKTKPVAVCKQYIIYLLRVSLSYFSGEPHQFRPLFSNSSWAVLTDVQAGGSLKPMHMGCNSSLTPQKHLTTLTWMDLSRQLCYSPVRN